MQRKQLSITSTSLNLLRTLVLEVLDGFGNKNLGRDGVAGNLRYDVPTTGQRGGNVLTDAEAEEDKEAQATNQAACCLIMSDDGKVLAVSRRDDPTQLGFPGGKMDPGEDLITTATRELKEETGLDIVDLRQVFVHKEDDGYVTTTFVGKVSGQIETDEEGLIRWVKPSVLMNPETSPFASYNRALFMKLGF